MRQNMDGSHEDQSKRNLPSVPLSPVFTARERDELSLL
jgi:hypothetical protein